MDSIRTCSVDGCDRKVKGRGYCGPHYSAWRRSTPREAQGWPTRSERFWSKVDRSGGPDACWPFTGTISEHGYGAFHSGGGSRKAHRYAYLIQNGREARGDVDHTCHNGSGCTRVNDCPHRRCCNPRHLEDVSRRENRNRGNSPDVMGSQRNRTHCPHGHEYTPENTWRNKRGHRFCRSCARDNQARMRARRREEVRP